jgi:DNA mismatch endonuclease (patch repair protein)
VPDKLTPEQRSRNMSHVKGSNTKPELAVRKLLHKQGFRFRLHRKDLAGRPDIVLPKYRTVIFVHGCFWHGHEGCPKAVRPTANAEFWNKKLDGNKARDRLVRADLEKLGWSVIIVWQCEMNSEDLGDRLAQLISKSGSHANDQ